MRKLTILADQFENKLKKIAEYGGSKFELPATHKAAMVVPKGGSSCANCQFSEMKEDGPHCNNHYFVQWNSGKSRLPVDDPTTYCSDWFEAK